MTIWPVAVAVAIGAQVAATEEHRGVWLHLDQYGTREACDRYVQRMAAARINVAYPLVWYRGGQATWRTESCAMESAVTDDYDPLGYLVESCHKNGIQVHAWFVNGALGTAKPLGPLSERTDWLVQTAPGQQAQWWDLGQPAVREFQANLMVEVLKKYDVDGVHFDYIRYDGPMLCFCDHCVREFRERSGYDVAVLAGEKFPLSRFISGNPMAGPTTAQVLVSVADGPPAVAVNRLGQGQVLILNWHVYNDPAAAVNTLLKRFLEKVRRSADSPLLVYRPEATIPRYGTQVLGRVREWLAALGYNARVIRDAELENLPPDAVVFLVGAYYTPEEVASKLCAHVENGGDVVVMDGPVYSMKEPSVQRLTGFQTTAPYYSGLRTLVVVQESELVPAGGEVLSEEEIRRIGEAWAQYRKDGVTELVRMVFERAKAVRPTAAVTAAVFSSRQSAEGVFQEWPRWLGEGIIDYVLPMAYVMENDKLAQLIAEWKELDPELQRIIPGLSLYQRNGDAVSPRPPDLVLQQVEMCREAGAKGVNFFALGYLSDEITAGLVEGPFREDAKPYVPLINRP